MLFRSRISSQTELLFTKEGRKGMISSIKIEMEKAVEKENYLDEDERVLINKFIKKIRDELRSAE